MEKNKAIPAAPVQSHTLQQDMEALKFWVTEQLRPTVLAQEDKPEPSEPPFSRAVTRASAYDDFLIKFRPDLSERIILLLAMAPHLQANFFEAIILKLFPQGGDLPEIGGAKGQHHRGMMPTAETAAFLLPGEPFQVKKKLRAIFSKTHYFSKEDVLSLEQVAPGEPKLSGRILLSEEYAEYFFTGSFGRPDFSPDFPAKLVTTKMKWNDLVLHPYTAEQMEDIKRWLYYHRILEKDTNLSRKIASGYRALFYGPPGTGKTLTATLMGKEFKRDVYRIDLSQIVSKYIGETEKNLDKVFSRAHHKDWMLFFDEADALFGKRTNVQNAHDKYANQETAFLLQRIEDFPGLIILASNFKSNIDTAFLRRFDAVVHFPLPNAAERLKLWEQSLPVSIKYEELPLLQLAADYEISGAAIINVMQYACLKALAGERKILTHTDVLEGIRREKRKEER